MIIKILVVNFERFVLRLKNNKLNLTKYFMNQWLSQFE